MQGETGPEGIWVARGGSGERLVVLLHGIAANASVFTRLVPLIEARGWRWLAPDFRGHGRSIMEGPYGFGNHAADIARLLAAEDPAQVTLLGHSFGGVVAALLGTGLFGPKPSRLVAYGTKIDWTPAEIAGAQAAATKPRKHFATRAEAAERYLKMSGLAGLLDPDAPEVAPGIVALKDGFTLAADPGVFSAVGPSIDSIFAQVAVTMRLAMGENDRVASPEALRRHDPGAILWPGLGHNVQTEGPERLIALLA